MKHINKELVEKYEKMYFLEGIPDEDKEELSQLYEDFTKYLITVGEIILFGVSAILERYSFL